MHAAATWIRDELFRRALQERATEGKNRVTFTAGSNAAGKSTALAFTRAPERAQAVFDSTLSNPEHARLLVDQVLAAEKRVGIIYIRRPLEDAFEGMLARARCEGRVVTINQLVNSHQGAAASVRTLWQDFAGDVRLEFAFIDNSGEVPRLSTIELTAPQDYTVIRKRLYELLNEEYQAGGITEEVYRRIGGRGDSG